MDTQESVVVRDDAERSRFELTVDGQLAGVARYRRRGRQLVFVHTEIDPKFEGRGLGSKLAAGALDSARRNSELIVPLCSFIASYISTHPEQADLVDRELLARLRELAS